MARATITIDTAAYRRTHGSAPWQTQGEGKRMWAFTLDAQPHVVVKYGTYHDALTWATPQAQRTVTLLP